MLGCEYLASCLVSAAGSFLTFVGSTLQRVRELWALVPPGCQRSPRDYTSLALCCKVLNTASSAL